MRRKRKVIFLIIIGFFVLFFFMPPVMICKGGLVFGKNASKYDSVETYMHEQYTSVNNIVYYTTDFENFYVINFKFWQEIKIRQSEFLENHEEIKERKINPWLYAVEQNQKQKTLNMYEVKRGKHCWYFAYFAAIH